MFTALLLDLDGTLADPWQGISSCIRYALKRMGLPNVSDAVLRDAIGPPLRMSFKSLLQAHRQIVCDADIEIAVEFYRERYASLGLYENERYLGIDSALQQAHQAGIKLHVVTSKPEVYARKIITDLGLDVWIKEIYGSELDGTRSDKSELIAYTLDQQNLNAKRTAMLGDRKYDMLGAKKQGVYALAAGWGYGDSTELFAAGCDKLLHDPTELCSWLKTHSGA